MRTLRGDPEGEADKARLHPGESEGRQGERGSEKAEEGGGSEPPWEIQVYCQQRRGCSGSEPPPSRAAGDRRGTERGGGGSGVPGRPGGAPRPSARCRAWKGGGRHLGWLFPSRRHLPRREGQGRVAQRERGGRKARGLEEKVRAGEGKGTRKRRKAPGSTSPLGAALQLLSNQLLASIHRRHGTKKWLFIRILVWYCSAPHKRRFIMLGWGEKPLSLFFFFFPFPFLFFFFFSLPFLSRAKQ